MKIILHYLMLFFGVPLIWGYLKIVQLCSKITISGEQEPDRLMSEEKAHLFVFWHNRQFILPLLRPRDTIHCLISVSEDGDYMTSLIRLFNKRAVRGSSSRNGLVSMKHMMRLLRDGEALGVATDGPRGPAFEVKPGVVQMAQAAQVPIIPVSYDATNKKVLTSWDSSYLLFPFGRIAIVYGPPILIAPEQSIEEACEKVRLGLVEAGDTASKLIAAD